MQYSLIHQKALQFEIQKENSGWNVASILINFSKLLFENMNDDSVWYSVFNLVSKAWLTFSYMKTLVMKF